MKRSILSLYINRDNDNYCNEWYVYNYNLLFIFWLSPWKFSRNNIDSADKSLFNPLSASVAQQINWLVSIWGRHWHHSKLSIKTPEWLQIILFYCSVFWFNFFFLLVNIWLSVVIIKWLEVLEMGDLKNMVLVLYTEETVAPGCFVKKMFLNIFQNSQENICARVSF